MGVLREVGGELYELILRVARTVGGGGDQVVVCVCVGGLKTLALRGVGGSRAGAGLYY